MTLAEIEARLRSYARAEITVPPPKRAAVSLILHPNEAGPEILVIQRAERSGDPWSGHMGLPGGRYQPGDRDLHDTAVRETREETGVDLRAAAITVAPLDDLQAVGRGRVLDLVITPFVHVVTGERPSLAIDRREVEHALWIPVGALHSQDARTTHHFELDGREFTAPALAYGQYTIWGLTYRILNRFFALTLE